MASPPVKRVRVKFLRPLDGAGGGKKETKERPRKRKATNRSFLWFYHASNISLGMKREEAESWMGDEKRKRARVTPRR